ncbi:MAG TPA: secondary thiamine-phosphate synthase enzyme YjbQ [Steroidobacteraceae bacterium]|jgi:secondary thiamine-phosphate synthase enzyme|nr:secondary thiamine-phosphate synthase enzyme YjbQ [Steroidobacteraceae bacterium]
MWRQAQLQIATHGRGFHELTGELEGRVRESGIRTGLCHVFLRHTSAGLCVTENADPEVRRDLERFAQRLAPDGDALFQHDTEGPDDMPAHVRNLVLGYELSVPIREGHLALGTWQGVFLWEHRHGAMRRELLVTLHGEAGAG